MNKQHILEEIKRTAAANGGKPLGAHKFSQETGVREYDWRGKHWVRWSDAVREAGLEPNQKQEAYDEDMLIEKLITLIRELGHYPVQAEVLLKANNDDNFSGEQSFRKFGRTQQGVSRVLEYCRRNAGYDDIITLCEAIVTPLNAPPEDDTKSNVTFGYVYLIKSGKSGSTYKIGWSKNSIIRQYQLQTGSPERLNLIHEIKTDDPSGIENYWHRRFAARRIDPNKEWFKLTSNDVKAFKRMKFA